MPAAGVPVRVAVPLPLSVKLTPAGSVASPSDNAAAGNPVVVTVKLPSWPTLKLVLAALVIDGATPAYTNSSIRWLPTSGANTFPDPSTATPYG